MQHYCDWPASECESLWLRASPTTHVVNLHGCLFLTVTAALKQKNKVFKEQRLPPWWCKMEKSHERPAAAGGSGRSGGQGGCPEKAEYFTSRMFFFFEFHAQPCFDTFNETHL